MAFFPCKFEDPKTGEIYQWPLNPDWNAQTQGAGKAMSIQRSATSANVGPVDQQGDAGPYVFHIETGVYFAEQEAAFWEWFQKCRQQSIYFHDWMGNVANGQITMLTMQWQGAAGGLGDVAERAGFQRAVLEFRVYNWVSGPMAAAGVTP